MIVLVLNAGSSTLKYSLIDSEGERVLVEGGTDVAPGQYDNALALALEKVAHGPKIDAVGHRIVHGGGRYTSGVRVTAEVKSVLRELCELAPLHNPANLEGVLAAETALPNVPQVVVFDTAFHATIPPEAHVYPVPYSWYADWGLRRYGFHGLSHAYCTGRAAEMLGVTAVGRLIVCHLGNGCSISAIREGRCVDTSMGFTPLDGVMMGTRSGSVDPSLLVYAMRHKGLSADDIDRVLNKESGLLGVSGVSLDVRQVQAAAREGNERARLALDIYAHRIRQTIGAMTATLGGVDALVFTAGVGEHSVEVRAQVCRGLNALGLELDATANTTLHPDADIAMKGSRARILLIATREDVMIVRATVQALS
jgi:acetate kinase